MTERKMCKFYNLNIPTRSLKVQGDTNQTHSDDEEQVNTAPESLLPLEVPPHEHKLQFNYCLWFSRRPPPGPRNPTNGYEGYGQALKLVGRCASVEQWWGMYSHLARPSELPPLTDLSLFKLGIKPMWEDPENVNGGKWVVRLKKSVSGRAWEDLCMAMLGEQFLVGPELCGVVISVRFQEDHLALWHKTASDTECIMRIRDTMKRILHLPPNMPMDYKAHGDCIRASAERRAENNLNHNNSASPAPSSSS